MNPGRRITIREMGGFIGAAWMKAATPANITSGFRSAGIWPFDRNIFSDADFASSLPTEQSAPQPDNPGVFHGEIPTNSCAQHGDGTPIQRTEEQQCNKTPVILGVNVKGFTPPPLMSLQDFLK